MTGPGQGALEPAVSPPTDWGQTERGLDWQLTEGVEGDHAELDQQTRCWLRPALKLRLGRQAQLNWTLTVSLTGLLAGRLKQAMTAGQVGLPFEHLPLAEMRPGSGEWTLILRWDQPGWTGWLARRRLKIRRAEELIRAINAREERLHHMQLAWLERTHRQRAWARQQQGARLDLGQLSASAPLGKETTFKGVVNFLLGPQHLTSCVAARSGAVSGVHLLIREGGTSHAITGLWVETGRGDGQWIADHNPESRRTLDPSVTAQVAALLRAHQRTTELAGAGLMLSGR